MDDSERFGLLRCPQCTQPLRVDSRSLKCPAGHTFDIAREGYVNLLPPRGGSHRVHGDSAAMVDARGRFFACGHYTPLAHALIGVLDHALAGRGVPRLLDAGCGEGHLLGMLVDGLVADGQRPRVYGFDLSKAAIRLAARRLPHAALAVANVRHAWPFAAAVFDVVLSVLAPRNGVEFARMLRPGGRLVIVIPGPDHLANLRAIVPLLPVSPDKESRLLGDLAGFHLQSRQEVRFPLRLAGEDAGLLVDMTPNAWAVPGTDKATLRGRGEVTTDASFVVLVLSREDAS